jgi:excisionase family DNA binding protein
MGEVLDSLFSVEQAAERLGGISKWTVHAWLSKGKLRRTKVGSRTMIRESDLQAFLTDCNPESSAQIETTLSSAKAGCRS